jgi:hypothetical protein
MTDVDRNRGDDLDAEAGYRPQSRDTDAVFERALFERFGTMDVTEKAELIDAMARDADHLVRAGVRFRHPAADDREIELRALALRLGRDWMLRAYGWDPDVEGW